LLYDNTFRIRFFHAVVDMACILLDRLVDHSGTPDITISEIIDESMMFGWIGGFQGCDKHAKCPFYVPTIIGDIFHESIFLLSWAIYIYMRYSCRWWNLYIFWGGEEGLPNFCNLWYMPFPYSISLGIFLSYDASLVFMFYGSGTLNLLWTSTLCSKNLQLGQYFLCFFYITLGWVLPLKWWQSCHHHCSKAQTLHIYLSISLSWYVGFGT